MSPLTSLKDVVYLSGVPVSDHQSAEQASGERVHDALKIVIKSSPIALRIRIKKPFRRQLSPHLNNN